MKQEENGREAAGTVANGTVAVGETLIFREARENSLLIAKFLNFAISCEFR